MYDNFLEIKKAVNFVKFEIMISIKKNYTALIV